MTSEVRAGTPYSHLLGGSRPLRHATPLRERYGNRREGSSALDTASLAR